MSEEKTEKEPELTDAQKAELFVKNPAEGTKLVEAKDKKDKERAEAEPKPEPTPKPAAKK